MKNIRKVRDDMLYVSEPPPSWFGNPPNEVGHKNWTNANWLKSRFHTSFAEYSNPKNDRFGVIRVLNDDLVQPSRGFGTHPHSNMEIVTYIVEGELSHKDSTGTSETLGRGSVQFMTAGTGVRHSEFNHNSTSVCRFIQMWFPPRKMNLPVNYGGYVGEKDARHNKWQHLVTDNQNKALKTPITIEQDTNLYVAELDASKSVSIALNSGRMAYFVCLEGGVKLELVANGTTSETEQLTRHDAAEIFGGFDLRVTAVETGAHVLLVEMKSDPGSSRFR